MEVERELERGLGSVGKVRILWVLSRDKEKTYTKYALRRLTGIKDIHIKRNIEELVDIGWVKEYGVTAKTYGLNLEKEAVKALIQFFERLRTI